MGDLGSLGVGRIEIPWELLHKLIPGQGIMDIRPDCGLLRDGRAFATMHCCRERYFLFPNKYNYIHHFLTYYINNARTSSYIPRNGPYLTLQAITTFPRMKAVSATVEDLQLVASTIPDVMITSNPPKLVFDMQKL